MIMMKKYELSFYLTNTTSSSAMLPGTKLLENFIYILQQKKLLGKKVFRREIP